MTEFWFFVFLLAFVGVGSYFHKQEVSFFLMFIGPSIILIVEYRPT